MGEGVHEFFTSRQDTADLVKMFFLRFGAHLLSLPRNDRD